MIADNPERPLTEFIVEAGAQASAQEPSSDNFGFASSLPRGSLAQPP